LLRLRQLVAGIDLRSAATALARLRKKGAPAAFSVTVSFVGKRNYSGAEVRNVLAAEVAQRHGWIYQPDDRLATLNVRVFMDHEETIVGVRLAQTPLHDRPYQRVHRPGALKPPVAAALASLAEVGFGCLVLDPCCGSGTVLIEAALQGASICGGDSDRLALAAARRNLAAAKIPAILQHWDARALPLPDASVDKVICNLPWGRQVALREPRQALYPQIVAEMRRVLRPAGRIVLLTDEREAMDKLELLTLQQFEISLFGQRPTISIYAHPRVE
jgi:23S rRNA G2445 N2-methylase RlmL